MQNLLQTGRQAGRTNNKTFPFELLLKGKANTQGGKTPTIQFAEFFGSKSIENKSSVKTSNIAQIIKIQKSSKLEKNNILIKNDSNIQDKAGNKLISKTKIQSKKYDIANTGQEVEVDIINTITTNTKLKIKSSEFKNLEFDLVENPKKETIVKSESKISKDILATGKTKNKIANHSEEAETANKFTEIKTYKNITGLKNQINVADTLTKKVNNTIINTTAKNSDKTEKIIITNVNDELKNSASKVKTEFVNSAVGVVKNIKTTIKSINKTVKTVDGKSLKIDLKSQKSSINKAENILNKRNETKVEIAATKKGGFTPEANEKITQNNTALKSTLNFKNVDVTKNNSVKINYIGSSPKLTAKAKQENQTVVTKSENKKEDSTKTHAKLNPVVSLNTKSAKRNENISQQSNSQNNAKNTHVKTNPVVSLNTKSAKRNENISQQSNSQNNAKNTHVKRIRLYH